MKKDVIYIDTEDDITAIIGKVKTASAKIVALVPPKRTGVLQSAVNLKLLQKSALAHGKRIVLITSDHMLTSLAAGVRIPIAKNLQSKPEIPTFTPAQSDESEVINGEELPVGEIAAAAGSAVPGQAAGSVADDISDHVDLADTHEPAAKKPASKFAGKVKIPNFDIFRKRLLLIGLGAVALIVLLVWATVIAPTATITISAKTEAVNIDRTLSLVPSLSASKPDALQLKPVSKQLKKTVSADFTATGTKDIGQKATGTITIRNCDYPTGFTLPTGTRFTGTEGHVFVSTADVSVPQFTGSASSCTLAGSHAGSAPVTVEALAIGPDYNVPAQAYTFPQTGKVDAQGTAMAGGSKDTVTVVSQDDIDGAKQKLTQPDQNAAKQELRKQFGGDLVVIDESFSVDTGNPVASPAAGSQAKQGKLTQDNTYTLVAVSRDDIKQVLDGSFKDALASKPNQSVFSNGENTLHFQSFQKLSDNTSTARMTTTGYIGAKIDTKQLAQQIKGKRYGEIEQQVNQIPGVDKANIVLSPFWVSSAPNDPNKITIQFTIINDTH
jgi:hypothetical protein